MNEKPPDFLQYESRDNSRRRRRKRRQTNKSGPGLFTIGIAAGCAVSGLVWLLVWKGAANLEAVLVVAGAKLVVALALIIGGKPNRYLGIGLIVSIGLMGLILFGICANAMGKLSH
jgi:1,4-dihydroxy-2-naphthoate octaprenyltransferase